MNPGRQEGVATLIALLAMLLMTALGVGLILSSTTETYIAANFRSSREARYAADAIVERAMDDITTATDWNALLSGAFRSSFVDGPPSGQRRLPDGSTIDLAQIVNQADCEKATACSAADMNANTARRPWGSNNPRWQLFAYGRLSDMLPGHAIESPFYVTLLVADDPSENDGDPLHDGSSASNPGSGLLSMQAESFGPRGAHQTIEITLARIDTGEVEGELDDSTGYNKLPDGQAGVRILSWREVR